MKGFNKKIPDYLCFTANTAGSTVQLTKTHDPTVVSLETSTDGTNWTAYTIGDTITLSNIGDKVYWRNTSETPTQFSVYAFYTENYYQFVMTGSIAASGDVSSLLCKNLTNSVSAWCFDKLFYGCSSLTTAPKLTATNTEERCYNEMFTNCTNLTTLPKILATTFASYCCENMFAYCSNIKLATTQDSTYQNEYRLPTTGTGTQSNSFGNMFIYTGGTFTGTPTINTTYYTSNQVI